MAEWPEVAVARELVYACIVRNHRLVDVIKATPGRALPGTYDVEVEIMNCWRSFGVVAGVIEHGELQLAGEARQVLAELQDGSYWCIAYLPLWDGSAEP